MNASSNAPQLFPLILHQVICPSGGVTELVSSPSVKNIQRVTRIDP
jgi:hypothetical protein